MAKLKKFKDFENWKITATLKDGNGNETKLKWDKGKEESVHIFLQRMFKTIGIKPKSN